MLALASLAALLTPQVVRGLPHPAAAAPESPAPAAVGYPRVSPQSEVTSDVGVTNIISYVASAGRGEVVTVEVTVQNLGSGVAWFPLTLLETGAGSALDSVTLTMQGGQQITIGLNWDTSGVAPQDYYLAALTGLEGDQNTANDLMALAWPITVTTPDITLGNELGIEVPDASFGSTLLPPQIVTVPTPYQAEIRLGDSEALEVPDASFGGRLLAAEIETVAIPLQLEIRLGDGEGLEVPDASFGGSLLAAEIETAAIAGQSDIEFGIEFPDGSFRGSLPLPQIDTPASPNATPFVGNADAQYSGPLATAGVETLGTPRPGTIEGVVRLEDRKDSWGGFLEVGEEVYLLEANGRYTVEVAADPVDVLVKAPGYLSALIPGVQVPPGEVVDIPRITLRFGDGNDDGRIDIIDLNMAAGNFGDTTDEVAPQ